MERSGALAFAAIVAVAAIVSIGLVVVFDQVDHVAMFLLVPMMLALGLIPIGLRVARGQFDLFEIIVPYFGMFFLFYGVGAFLTLFIHGVAYDLNIIPYLDLAVAYCTLGFAAAMVGYGITGKIVPPRLEGSLTMGVIPIAVLYTVGYMGILTSAAQDRLAMTRNVFVSGVTSLVSQLSFLTTFTIFYVLYMMMKKQGSQFTLLFWGWMVPSQFLGLFLRVGNKTALVAAFGLPIIAWWYARRRFAWKSVTAFLLLFVFIVFPLYYRIRNFTNPFYSQQYRIARSLEELTTQRVYASEDALKTVARRVSIINSTVVVVRDCGTTVDYEYGSTLWLGVISVAIPRILWPDKPLINIGTQFGRTFRITGFANYSAISLSMVGELYWNFNVPGVLIGMFLMGFCMRAVYQRFGANQGSDPVRLAIYVTLMYAIMISSEGNIGGLEGQLVKQVLILVVIERGFMLMNTIMEKRRLLQSPALTVAR